MTTACGGTLLYSKTLSNDTEVDYFMTLTSTFFSIFNSVATGGIDISQTHLVRIAKLCRDNSNASK